MARTYQEMTKDELLREQESLLARYKDFQAKGLQLDMSRGKPCKEQLDLSVGMNDVKDYVSGGVDVRNYGILDGIASCKQLFAELLEVPAENVIIGPNESLTLMFDFICQCYTHGIGGKPWSQEKEVKILCPVPGYDRHFTVCQYFGLQMVNVPMNADGPDMDTIEELVKDPSVKGMFCVPKYSNPTGITFSDAVVRRIAALRPAAEDFRIVWDNAYCVHDLDEDGDKLLNIFDVLPEYGNEDMVIEVASTSKITFPGAGVSCLVASKKNLDLIRQRLTVQTISYDKMNQLRHLRFFGGKFENLLEHMKKHKALIAPKFAIVVNTLEKELGDLGIATWSNPKGGYFISFNQKGCAKRIVQLCKDAGVVLTGAGASFPYGVDPEDENIRISPTFPTEEELQKAMDVFVCSAKLAAAEQLLAD